MNACPPNSVARPAAARTEKRFSSSSMRTMTRATIAQCALVGLLLAFTRRNPFLTREGVGITAALPKGRKR